MPESAATVTEIAFVPRALRPTLSGQVDAPPLQASNAPPEELRKLAEDALGRLLMEQLDSAGGPSVAPPMVYTPAPHVVSTDIESDMVLLDLRSGMYYTLNRVGTVVWGLLGGGNTLEAIHKTLCDRFVVPAEQAWGDLIALVRALHRERLVVEYA
jgi:Coenzyme PQQ synthesis protein D (PqqD)